MENDDRIKNIKKSYHLWSPNIGSEKGGIQVYSTFMLIALEKLYPDVKCEVFLKLDRYLSLGVGHSKSTQFHLTGSWPKFLRTGVFAAELLGYGMWKHPDLVVSTHLNFTVAAYWLKMLTNVPYWAIAHGVESWNIQRPALKKALHHADRILAVSHYTRDRLLAEQNLDPAKIKILPNTFDERRFQISSKPTYLLQRYHLSPERSTILTVARLNRQEQYKGYDRLLQALPTIIKEIPNLHYLIIGKGDDLARVEQMIQYLNLQSRVTLAGFVPDDELCDHYNLCDVFAMPSKGEGFGIVYLEALACGKPTLGGNRDGAIDALCHGELGALVDPDNIEEIAQTLIQILQGDYPNPLIYQPQALRQKAIDIFGFDKFQQTLGLHLSEFWQTKNLEGVND